MSDTLSALGNLTSNALAIGSAYFIQGKGPNRTQVARTPPALYSLVLRGPSAPYLPLAIYSFPMSPQNIRRDVVGLGNTYNVQGNASNFGVTVIPDIYGQTPPVYTIQGTTGVKYHTRDGMVWTGLQSVQILTGIISQYFSLNAAVAQAGSSNLFRLEFYDYYMEEFWQIVPLGPQGLMQSSARPQLVFYSFRWEAVQSLEQPIAALLDPLLSALGTPISQAFNGLGSSISNFLGSYSGNSPT
jgi:hypothetical protein